MEDLGIIPIPREHLESSLTSTCYPPDMACSTLERKGHSGRRPWPTSYLLQRWRTSYEDLSQPIFLQWTCRIGMSVWWVNIGHTMLRRPFLRRPSISPMLCPPYLRQPCPTRRTGRVGASSFLLLWSLCRIQHLFPSRGVVLMLPQPTTTPIRHTSTIHLTWSHRHRHPPHMMTPHQALADNCHNRYTPPILTGQASHLALPPRSSRLDRHRP